MNSMKDRHPLEGHLSDYLNDHLSEQDRVRFEEALREDASLQDMLALERRIQAECKKTTAVAAQTGSLTRKQRTGRPT